MRFSIISESKEFYIPRGGLGSLGYFPVCISAYDEGDSSRIFLEQLDCLFLEKYGEKATDYFNIFDRVLRKSVEFCAQWHCNSMCVLMFGKLLEMLFEILSSEVRIRVEFHDMKVKYLKYHPTGPPTFSKDVITFPAEYQVLTSKEMMIDCQPGYKVSYCRYICRDRSMQIPSLWKPYLDGSNSKVALCGKIKAEVSTCGFNYTISSVSERCLTTHQLNKVILEEAILTDVVIIGDNGKEVKCHRNFLAARSRILATMFVNDWREPTICRVEMKDMSEELINAFLSYLYFGDLTAARENSKIMSDLLNAGQKYEIGSLVEDVKGIQF